MTEVWELSYFGQGGFPYEQVWEMPITTRRFFLKKIEEHIRIMREKENERNQVITENTDPKKIKKIDVPDHLLPKEASPSYVSKVKSKR
jgi:hypothetical protein